MGLASMLGLRRKTGALVVTHFRNTPGAWLSTVVSPAPTPVGPHDALIEERAAQTQAAGERPLWEGYAKVTNYPRSNTGARTSDQVRTAATMGRFFAWLASTRRPDVIVEVGTAFGVSGMYWLSGLEQAGRGELITFDPNEGWTELARDNLSAISKRFTQIGATFEDSADRALGGRPVGLAFIDAIHTSDFVHAQYAALRPHLAPGALVLFDDINFSDDMARCWEDLRSSGDFAATAQFGSRVGIAELPAAA